MTPARFLPIIAITLLAAAPITRAGDITYPDTAPAFTLEIPDGWSSAKTDSGLLQLKNAGSNGVLSINVPGDAAELVKMPYDDFAQQIFESVGIQKIEKKEAARFAGLKAMAYYGSLKKSNGTLLNLKITIAHVDKNHIAVITQSTAADISKPALAEVEKVVESAKPAPVAKPTPATKPTPAK